MIRRRERCIVDTGDGMGALGDFAEAIDAGVSEGAAA